MGSEMWIRDSGLASWGVERNMSWAKTDMRVLKPIWNKIDSLTLDGLSPGEKAALNALLAKERNKKSLARSRDNLDPNYRCATRQYL